MNASAPALRFSVVDDLPCNAVLFARTLADVGYRIRAQAIDPATLLSNCIASKYDLISLAAADHNTKGAEAYACLKSINDAAYPTVLIVSDAPHSRVRDEKNNSGSAHARHHGRGPFDVMAAWFAAIAARFAQPKAVMRRYDFGALPSSPTVAATSTTRSQ